MSIQISGTSAIVSQLNRAFLDTAPSNSDFNTQIAKIPGITSDPLKAINGAVLATDAYAFANTFAAQFATMSNAALSKEVLTNMGILPSTDTSVVALEAELVRYFDAFGSQTKDATGAVTADTRGTIVLQLANIMSGLENASGNLAVYKAAALAWNNEIAGSAAYSNTATNTVASAKGSIANQPANLALTLENDTKTGTAGDDTFDAKTVGNSLNGTDTLDGGDGKDTLNVATSATSIASGITIKAIENVNIVSSGNGLTVDATKAALSGVTNLNVSNTTGGAIVITAPTTATVTATTVAGSPSAAAPGSAAATAAAATAAAIAAVAITTPGTGASAVAGSTGNSADQANLTAAAAALTAAATALKAAGTTVAATNAANVATAAAANATTAAANAGATGSASDKGTLDAAAAALAAARDVLVSMSIGLNGGSAPAASPVTVNGGGGVLTVTAGTNEDVHVGQTAVAAALTSASITGGKLVNITDQSSTKTLTTVSLNGNSGAATLTGDGLTTLNLTKVATATTVNNATVSHALTLNTNGLKAGAVVTDIAATTVNIANTVADSNLALTTGLATALNISGDKAVTLTTATLANTAVVTSTNTAGVTIPLTDATQSFQGSAAGNDTVTIVAPATKTLDGGVGGTDTLVVNAPDTAIMASTWWTNFTTGVTSAGTSGTAAANAAALANASAADVKNATANAKTAAAAGSAAAAAAAIDDAAGAAITAGATTPAAVLKAVQAAQAAYVATAAGATGATAAEAVAATAAASAAAVAAAATGANPTSISTAAQTGITSLGNVYNATNFEVLSLGALAKGVYDATGFTSLTEGLVAGDVTFNNVANSSTLTITASPTKDTTVSVVNAAAGLADALTINLGSSVEAKKVTTTGVENLTINTAGANSITLADAALQNLTITGNGTLTLAAANFAIAPNTTTPNQGLSLVDASAATGKLTLDFSTLGATAAATTGLEIRGGAAADTIALPANTVTPTNLPIVTLGGGADALYVGNTKVVAAGTNTATVTNFLSLATQFTTVRDFSVGDVIGFGTNAAATPTLANASGKLGAALVSAVDDYNAFLLLATSQQSTGQVTWFQTGGNTFVVQDNNGGAGAAAAGIATNDVIVKLVGTIDLSNATVVTGGAAGGGTITMV